MSNPIPRKKIEQALIDKGFQLDDQDRNQRFYFFYHEGKKTMVRTKISTGSSYGQYDDSLFIRMKPQLQLQSVREVRDLLGCPMSLGDFTKLLVDRGRIPNDESSKTDHTGSKSGG